MYRINITLYWNLGSLTLKNSHRLLSFKFDSERFVVMAALICSSVHPLSVLLMSGFLRTFLLWGDSANHCSTQLHSSIAQSLSVSMSLLLRNISITWGFHHLRDGISQVMCNTCIFIFLHQILLAVLPKDLHYCLIRPENIFPHIALYCYLINTVYTIYTVALYCLYLCPLYHSATKAWLMECCRNGCLSNCISHLCPGLLSSWILSYLLHQGPSFMDTLERFKVVPRFFHFKITEAAVVLGTLKLEIVLYSCSDMCLAIIWSWRSIDCSWTWFITYFASWQCCVNYGPS